MTNSVVMHHQMNMLFTACGIIPFQNNSKLVLCVSGHGRPPCYSMMCTVAHGRGKRQTKTHLHVLRFCLSSFERQSPACSILESTLLFANRHLVS